MKILTGRVKLLLFVCKWMINAFKKENPNWEKILIVMADKDIGERDVIKQFTKCITLICLFHTLRRFRREVSCEKMGITSGHRMLCLELIQKLAYAHSDEKYNGLHCGRMTSPT